MPLWRMKPFTFTSVYTGMLSSSHNMVHIAALLNGELCLTLQNGSAGGTSLSIVTLPRMCLWYCLAITLVFLGYLSGVTMGLLGVLL